MANKNLSALRWFHNSEKVGLKSVAPAARWLVKNTELAVYHAKQCSEDWRHPGWLDFLRLIRRRSNLYGRRILIDSCDVKSSIYFAYARYPEKEGEVWEWLSVRIMPFWDEPEDNGELDKFLCQGRPVAEVMQERLFDGQENWRPVVAGGSRICGIAPYVYRGGRPRIIPVPGASLKYTAFLFSLILQQFLEDNCFRNVHYLIGSTVPALVKRSLSVKIGDRYYGSSLPPAYEILGFSQPKPVLVNRNMPGNYAYRYPAYWLNFKQLINLIEDLIKSGALTDESIKLYTGIAESFSRYIASPEFTPLGSLKNLGRLLTVRGVIRGSFITGERLRRLIDQFVEDGPELNIIPVELLAHSHREFFSAAGLKRIG